MPTYEDWALLGACALMAFFASDSRKIRALYEKLVETAEQAAREAAEEAERQRLTPPPLYPTKTTCPTPITVTATATSSHNPFFFDATEWISFLTWLLMFATFTTIAFTLMNAKATGRPISTVIKEAGFIGVDLAKSLVVATWNSIVQLFQDGCSAVYRFLGAFSDAIREVWLAQEEWLTAHEAALETPLSPTVSESPALHDSSVPPSPLAESASPVLQPSSPAPVIVEETVSPAPEAVASSLPARVVAPADDRRSGDVEKDRNYDESFVVLRKAEAMMNDKFVVVVVSILRRAFMVLSLEEVTISPLMLPSVSRGHTRRLRNWYRAHASVLEEVVDGLVKMTDHSPEDAPPLECDDATIQFIMEVVDTDSTKRRRAIPAELDLTGDDRAVLRGWLPKFVQVMNEHADAREVPFIDRVPGSIEW